jgi:hypothetical protein
MHDPQSVAHEIRWPWKNKFGNRVPFITIWHVDPVKDGTDDSCGSFIRKRHLPKGLFEKVRKDFEFEFKNNYWFNESGYPKFSTMGVTLAMYSRAAWTVFIWLNKDNPSKKANGRYKKFMRGYLFDILHFAENPLDGLHSSIHMTYGVVKQEERVDDFTSIVLCDIMRKLRPWYKHPRWHVRHWKLQIHPLQNIKRRYWDKCFVCGRRGFKSSAMSDWDGTKIWHQECDRSVAIPTPKQI